MYPTTIHPRTATFLDSSISDFGIILVASVKTMINTCHGSDLESSSRSRSYTVSNIVRHGALKDTNLAENFEDSMWS